MTTHSEMLAEVPFFALLDDQERATLAERLDLVIGARRADLYNAGDPGDSIFVVRAGEVELFFKNDTGDRIVLETARVGDFFGETSLMDGGPRTASAVVLADLEALVVDRGDLDEFFRACALPPPWTSSPRAAGGCARSRPCSGTRPRATSTR